MNDICLWLELLPPDRPPIDTRQTPDANSKNQGRKLVGRTVNYSIKICTYKNLFVLLQRKPRDTEKNTKKEKE